MRIRFDFETHIRTDRQAIGKEGQSHLTPPSHVPDQPATGDDGGPQSRIIPPQIINGWHIAWGARGAWLGCCCCGVYLSGRRWWGGGGRCGVPACVFPVLFVLGDDEEDEEDEDEKEENTEPLSTRMEHNTEHRTRPRPRAHPLRP
jgi:hypothetical protein